MQRYGWQTRQSRVNQSLNEPLPIQSNPSIAPQAKIKGNEKISSTVVQSKNSSLSSAPGIKQARVSRISSIDSNPLFQGMDTLQTQGKQMENPVTIKNEASYQTNIDETKNQQNSKIKRTRTQLTRNQVKLVVETAVETTRQQIPSLRFQKVNKPIQSTLPQKQYLTERPKHDYPIQKLNLQKSEQKQKEKNEYKDEDNNKIQEIRITNKAIIPRQQATERKKYDLLDDILFPHQRNARKAQTKAITNTQSLTDNQQSNPKPEKQSQQLGKHFSSNLNQHTKASQHQQKQLTSTKDKKQMPNKTNGNEKQEEKVIQTNQNVKMNVNDKNKSKILIFCINKLEIKNRGQCIGWCINKLKETKLRKEQVRVGARILSRISLQKMQQFKVYSMVKLVSINNSKKPRFKWPVSSTNATNFSTYRQFLTISLNSIFREKTKQAFNIIKSSRKLISNYIPIIMKLLTNYQVQIQKQVYRRTYDFSASRRQCKQRGIKRLVCKLSILVNCSLISPFYSLFWASFRPKYEDDNLEDETSIDNHQEIAFQSPIVTKNEAISAPNIALSDPSKKRKEEQTLAIRNTAKASNLAVLRLQKQLQSTQKLLQQQKQNNQLRIEQLKQIISEYNFQISSKKQRYKESQLILKQNSVQGEQENQNIKEQRSQKLQHLTSIYFTVLHHKQTTTESYGEGYLNCNQLLRLVQPCQELGNREVSQWGILFQNIKLKLQVEALQSSMEGKDGNVGGAMKKRSSWEYANREYQYLVGMVRNYIKQQYYWTKLGKDLQVNPGR